MTNYEKQMRSIKFDMERLQQALHYDLLLQENRMNALRIVNEIMHALATLDQHRDAEQ